VSDASYPPHAHPFRMIDLVLELDRERCSTIKTLTTDERVRDGPAASEAGYPFSLLLEAMVQAAVPLAGLQDEEHAHAVERPSRPSGMLVGIDGARLLRIARPGDRLLITATVTARLGEMIRVRSVAELAGSGPGEAIVAEGEFSIALQESR
jgi:3-hydroxymyristoyl/3-hydroxydecanoyl-(acyl carrier protein) dehydratase